MVKTSKNGKATQSEICLKCDGSYKLNEKKDKCVSLLEWKTERATANEFPKLNVRRDFVIEAKHTALTAKDFTADIS